VPFPANPIDEVEDGVADDGRGRLSMVVIGTEGAGKTVYLASLHNQLFSDPENRGYTIFTDLPTRNRLNALVRDIERPGVEWPKNTKSINTYTFTCRVRTAGGEIDLFDVQYTDYPGQLLVDTPEGTEPQVEQLKTAFKTADVVLVLVDGHEIRALIRDEPSRGGDYVGQRLRPIVQQALEQRLSCSVHIVVTKWDLLEAAGIDLGQVRDELLKIDFVRGLIESRTRDNGPIRGGGIRLIPVSAVGYGYAEPRVENGAEVMAKAAGRRMTPVNVDVPFAAILPDKVRQALASMTPNELKQARKLLRKLRRRQLGNVAARLVRAGSWFATPFTKVIVAVFPGGHAAVPVAIAILERIARSRLKLSTVTAGEVDDAWRRVEELEPVAREAERVMDQLLTTFEQRVLAFESQFPGGSLWSPAGGRAGTAP
jgi:hypothetical protein